MKGTVDEALGRPVLEEEVEEMTSWAPLHLGAGGKTGQWDRGGGVCVCVCMTPTEGGHYCACSTKCGHIEVCYLYVNCMWHFTLLLVLCCDSDSGECMGHMCTLLTFPLPCQ